MTPDLWSIPITANGRLAILARPRGGDWLEDEVAGWRRAGVDVVVSLLESHEVAELDLTEEAACCERAGVRFVSFPIPDRGVPHDRVQFNNLVAELGEALDLGRGVGLHCRAGIGRSGMGAVGVLSLLGIPPAEAIRAVAAARGREVPDTPEQAAWVSVFG